MNYSKRKRKSVTLIITLFITLILFTACGQNNPVSDSGDVYINKDYDDSGMLTVAKEEFDYSKGEIMKTAGLGVQLPQDIQKIKESGKLGVIGDGYTLYFIYLTEKGMEGLDADTIFQCYAISYILTNDENAEIKLEHIKNFFSNVEIITTVDDRVYYFAYNNDYSSIIATDEEKAEMDLLISSIEAVKNGICLFPPEMITLSTNMNMNDFNTKTLNGETFTQADLANYDLTMVNIWATWCGPCINEMPDLQSLYETLPKNVNMITVCADADKELEFAKQILTELGCNFQTLVPDEKLQKSLISEVTGFPTTIFVDSNGNMVGELQLGAPAINPAEEYMKTIEERLEAVTGAKERGQ